MNIDPAKVEIVRERGERMKRAIVELDAPAIAKLLLDPEVERVEFEVGRQYRLAVLGAPPVDHERSVPEPDDAVSTALKKLTGFDHEATVRDAGVVELRATYRGRLPSVGFPHSFRMLDGRMAMFADMDLIAWERI